MALKCLQQRYGIMECAPRLEALQKNATQFQQERKRKRHRQSNKNDEEQWTIGDRGDAGKDTNGPLLPASLSDELEQLIRVWTTGMEETLSRIHHASSALFLEVSRGFFLPFCSVALGALARIRAMLMEIGGHLALPSLYNLQGELQQFGGGKYLTESDYNRYMGILMDEASDDAFPKGAKTPDTAEILASLGLPSHVDHPRTSSSKTESTRPETDRDNGNLQESQGLEQPQSPTELEFDQDDVGESVTASNNASAAGDSRANVAKPIKDAHLIDQNMALVQVFQSKKPKPQQQAEESKGKAKKRKSEDDTLATDVAKTKKKSKKKKKSSKGNFFDDLFG